MANIVGKRYVCPVCASEVIVTRGGDGRLQCHGLRTQMKESSQPSTRQARPERNE